MVTPTDNSIIGQDGQPIDFANMTVAQIMAALGLNGATAAPAPAPSSGPLGPGGVPLYGPGGMFPWINADGSFAPGYNVSPGGDLYGPNGNAAYPGTPALTNGTQFDPNGLVSGYQTNDPRPLTNGQNFGTDPNNFYGWTPQEIAGLGPDTLGVMGYPNNMAALIAAGWDPNSYKPVPMTQMPNVGTLPGFNIPIGGTATPTPQATPLPSPFSAGDPTISVNDPNAVSFNTPPPFYAPLNGIPNSPVPFQPNPASLPPPFSTGGPTISVNPGPTMGAGATYLGNDPLAAGTDIAIPPASTSPAQTGPAYFPGTTIPVTPELVRQIYSNQLGQHSGLTSAQIQTAWAGASGTWKPGDPIPTMTPTDIAQYQNQAVKNAALPSQAGSSFAPNLNSQDASVFSHTPVTSKPIWAPETILADMKAQDAAAKTAYNQAHPAPTSNPQPSPQQLMYDTGMTWQDATRLLNDPGNVWQQYDPNWQANLAAPGYGDSLTAAMKAAMGTELNAPFPNPGINPGAPWLQGTLQEFNPNWQLGPNAGSFQFHTAPNAGVQILPNFFGDPANPGGAGQYGPNGAIQYFGAVDASGNPLGDIIPLGGGGATNFDPNAKASFAANFMNYYGGTQQALDQFAQRLGFTDWNALDFTKVSTGMNAPNSPLVSGNGTPITTLSQWNGSGGPGTYGAAQHAQDVSQQPYQPYQSANPQGAFTQLMQQINQNNQTAQNAFKNIQLGGNFGGGVIPNPGPNFTNSETANNTPSQIPTLVNGQWVTPPQNQFGMTNSGTLGQPGSSSFGNALPSQVNAGAPAGNPTTTAFGMPAQANPSTQTPAFGMPPDAANGAVSNIAAPQQGFGNNGGVGSWGTPQQPQTGGWSGWNPQQSNQQQAGSPWGGPWAYHNAWSPSQ